MNALTGEPSCLAARGRRCDTGDVTLPAPYPLDGVCVHDDMLPGRKGHNDGLVGDANLGARKFQTRTPDQCRAISIGRIYRQRIADRRQRLSVDVDWRRRGRRNPIHQRQWQRRCQRRGSVIPCSTRSGGVSLSEPQRLLNCLFTCARFWAPPSYGTCRTSPEGLVSGRQGKARQ
jgi:hypothetical protein